MAEDATATDLETTVDRDAINRYLNARDKHVRVVHQLDGRPGDQRLFYREQSLRFETLHARRELVRRIKMHSWNEGHEASCPEGRECEAHVNPYVIRNGTGDE